MPLPLPSRRRDADAAVAGVGGSRLRRRHGRAALVLALALVPAAGHAGPWVHDPACGVTGLVMRPGQMSYRLPHPFVRAGSDSAWTRLGGLRRGTDFVLDLVRGELRLLREPVPGDTLWVSACWLLEPPPLELRLLRYRPAAMASDSAVAAPPASRRAR